MTPFAPLKSARRRNAVDGMDKPPACPPRPQQNKSRRSGHLMCYQNRTSSFASDTFIYRFIFSVSTVRTARSDGVRAEKSLASDRAPLRLNLRPWRMIGDPRRRMLLWTSPLRRRGRTAAQGAMPLPQVPSPRTSFDHLPVAVVGVGELAPHPIEDRWQHPVRERRAVAQSAGLARQDRRAMPGIVDRLASAVAARGAQPPCALPGGSRSDRRKRGWRRGGRRRWR